MRRSSGTCGCQVAFAMGECCRITEWREFEARDQIQRQVGRKSYRVARSVPEESKVRSEVPDLAAVVGSEVDSVEGVIVGGEIGLDTEM